MMNVKIKPLALLVAMQFLPLFSFAQTTSVESPSAEQPPKPSKSNAQKPQSDIEIIKVTGDGREKLAAAVPMNITAMGEDELRNKNIADIKKLIADSVEISAPGNSARFAESVTVRGLNVSAVNANNLEQFVRSTLAYYLDETPLPHIGIRIKDVARVEKLLGPQGTLYGAGSLGGTVRYITNAPVLGEFDARINTSVYQTKHGGLSNDTDFMLNIPLSDTLSLRGSFARLDEAGFTDRFVNPVWRTGAAKWDGRPDKNTDVYEDDDWQVVNTGRLSALWAPTEDVQLKISHAEQHQLAHGTSGASIYPTKEGCAAAGYTTDCPLNSFTTAYQVNDHSVLSRYPEFSDRDFELNSIDFDIKFEKSSLHSSTSYFTDSRIGQADYASQGDAFYSWIPGLGFKSGNESAYMTFNNTYKGLSHETRLTSQLEGPWQYIVGVYHTNQKRNYKFSEWFERLDEILLETGYWFGLDRATVGGEVNEGYREDLGSDYTETALFGELSFDVTEKLNITAGARVFRYKDKGLGYLVDYAGALVDSEARANAENRTDNIFKLNTAYKFSDDVFSYLTLSQGFRRGGTNGFKNIGGNVVAASTQNFAPDTTDNIELGLKGYFFNKDLYVQTDIYRIRWNAPQTYYSQGVPDAFGFGIDFPVNGTVNGPDAQTKGWELSARYKISERIHLDYSTATTKGEFIDTLERCTYEANNRPADCRTWAKGGVLGGAPKWRHNLGVNYRTDLPNGGSLWASLSGRYIGKTNSDRTDSADEIPDYIRPAYRTVNASVGYGIEQWDLSLWVENLTDSNANISNQSGGALGRRMINLTPRTLGVNVSYSFF